MGLTNSGRNFIAGAIVNKDPDDGSDGMPNQFINGNAAIGVGNSTTTFSVSDTDLKASTYGTNKDKRGMESGYPTLSTNTLIFRSIFGLTDGNFDWNEWGIFNFTAENAPVASSGQYMINRSVEDLGTKANTQSWQFTVELVVNAA